MRSTINVVAVFNILKAVFNIFTTHKAFSRFSRPLKNSRLIQGFQGCSKIQGFF